MLRYPHPWPWSWIFKEWEGRLTWNERDVSRSFMTMTVTFVWSRWHYNDVIMSAMATQITGVSIVCSSVGSGEDQRKHQSPASLAFVLGIHRWPVNSPHKRPVTRKMFPFDDVIMGWMDVVWANDWCDNMRYTFALCFLCLMMHNDCIRYCDDQILNGLFAGVLQIPIEFMCAM